MRSRVRWPVLLLGLLGSLTIAGCSGVPSGPDGPTASGGTTGAVAEGLSVPSSFTADLDIDPETGKPRPIEAPTLADLAKAGPLGDRALGRADAPLTVVEYASLTCPHCRAFHDKTFAQVKKAYIDTGKVRWVLREFPIGHTSGYAWMVTRCAPEASYFKLFDLYLRNQKDWVSLEVRPDSLYGIASKVGMSRDEFDRCIKNQDIESGLKWVKARGRQLGVSGTPTFFIGATKVRSVLSFEEFEALVEPQLAGKTAAASG